MCTDLREIKNPEEAVKKVAKYTECFDLLDRLGADNCVDPDDFDQEDLNDDLFKNLHINDIEDIFKEDSPAFVGTTDGDECTPTPTGKSFKEQDEELIDLNFPEMAPVEIQYDNSDSDEGLLTDQDLKND